MKPKLTIYVTRYGTKYSVDMPIESPVRLQREMYFIAETIGEAAEKVEQKPQCTLGIITIRFKNELMGINTANKLSSDLNLGITFRNSDQPLGFSVSRKSELIYSYWMKMLPKLKSDLKIN